jgi:uridine kinase
MNYLKEISKQIKSKDKVIISIDGPSASGKTTFGKLLSEKFDALLIHSDDYFLPANKKTLERLSESGGNLDYIRLEEEVMKNIYSKEIVSNHFNCTTEQLEKKAPMNNKQVIIVEGAYSMHKNLRGYYTMSFLITIDKNLQKQRIFSRNGETMLKRWIEEWIPLEDFYFEEEKLEQTSDFVIDALELPTSIKFI